MQDIAEQPMEKQKIRLEEELSNFKQNEEQIEELFRHIGRLKVERDFLSKKLSL